MIEQSFTINDIQLGLVNGEGFAAVQLQPLAEPADSQSFNMPTGVNRPTPIRVTGGRASEVESWRLGDTVVLTLSRQTA